MKVWADGEDREDAVDIDETRPGRAAKEFIRDAFFAALAKVPKGFPDETRVHVIDAGGFEHVFDVHIEGLDLDLTVDRVRTVEPGGRDHG